MDNLHVLGSKRIVFLDFCTLSIVQYSKIKATFRELDLKIYKGAYSVGSLTKS